MQKVVGSNPISRSTKAPLRRGFLVSRVRRPITRRRRPRAPWCPVVPAQRRASLIERDTDFEVAGVRFTLFLTGGEAASEIGMYLPDYRTAVIADEVYIALPNLYTLRGAQFRDAMRWAAASEKVLALDVEPVLGCHMPPLEGREQIEKVLGIYQDAIQYNHDQAVRHILRGATAEELRTGLVERPDHVDLDPFTREMYGSVANNAAQQMTGYLGWFSGDATDPAPLPRAERASRTVALMGGRDQVIEAARAAFDDSDGQWCAELAAPCVSIDTEDREARELKAAGLRLLGYAEQNPLRRSFYLSGALEARRRLRPHDRQRSRPQDVHVPLATAPRAARCIPLQRPTERRGGPASGRQDQGRAERDFEPAEGPLPRAGLRGHDLGHAATGRCR
jgi:alkyl sulfatase BDS1-like metallo-beta-lactamase superfamily hydrolase